MPAEQRATVIARIRPKLTTVEKADDATAFETEDPDVISYRDQHKNEERRVRLNQVFGSEADNAAVSAAVVPGAMDAIRKGLGATVLHYGQSGSGKTYTMENCVRQQLLDEILRLPKKDEGITNFKAEMSVVQIHCGRPSDCLHKTKSKLPPEVNLKWTANGYEAEGVNWEEFTTVGEANALIEKADKRRATAYTNLNSNSSRSHALVFITAEWTAGSLTRKTRVTLVDLAGSENVKDSGATGSTLDEGIDIVSSLTCLNMVLESIVRNKGKPTFRNHVLTRLLQPSLTGSFITVVLCLSPAAVYLNEGISTLRFGINMTKFKVKPRREITAGNQAGLQQVIEEMQEEVGSLKEERDQVQRQMEAQEEEFRRREEELLNRLQSNAAAMEGAQEDIDALRQHNERLKQQADALERESTQRATEAAAAKEELAKKLALLADQEAQLKAAQESGTHNKEELAKMEDEIQDLLDVRDSLNLQISRNQQNETTLQEMRSTIQRQDAELARRTEETSKLANAAKMTEEMELRAQEVQKQKELVEATLGEKLDDVQRLREELAFVRGKLTAAEEHALGLERILTKERTTREQHMQSPQFEAAAKKHISKVNEREAEIVRLEKDFQDLLVELRKLTSRLPTDVHAEFSSRIKETEAEMKRLRRQIGSTVDEASQESHDLFDNGDVKAYASRAHRHANELKQPLRHMKDMISAVNYLTDAATQLTQKANATTEKPMSDEQKEVFRDTIRSIVEQLRERDPSKNAPQSNEASMSESLCSKSFRATRADEIEQLLQQLPASCEALINKMDAESSNADVIKDKDGVKLLAARVEDHMHRFNIVKTTADLIGLSTEAQHQLAEEHGPLFVKALEEILEKKNEPNFLVSFRFIGRITRRCTVGRKLFAPFIPTVVATLRETKNQNVMIAACTALLSYSLDDVASRKELATNADLVTAVAITLQQTNHDTPQVLKAAGRLAAQLAADKAIDRTLYAKQLLPVMATKASTKENAATVVASGLVNAIVSGSDDVKKATKAVIAEHPILQAKAREAMATTMIESSAHTMDVEEGTELRFHGTAIRGEWNSRTCGIGASSWSHNYLDNPQYILEVEEKTDAAILITDPHLELRSNLQKIGTMKSMCVGFRVYRHPNADLAKKGYPIVTANDIFASVDCFNTNSSTVHTELPPGVYVVIPCNFDGLYGSFSLAVCGSNKLKMYPADMEQLVCHSFESNFSPNITTFGSKDGSTPMFTECDHLMRDQYLFTPPPSSDGLALSAMSVSVSSFAAEEMYDELKRYDPSHTNTLEEMRKTADELQKVGLLGIGIDPVNSNPKTHGALGGPYHGSTDAGHWWRAKANQMTYLKAKEGPQWLKIYPRLPTEGDEKEEEAHKEDYRRTELHHVLIRVYAYAGSVVLAKPAWKNRYVLEGTLNKGNNELSVPIPTKLLQQKPAMVVFYSNNNEQFDSVKGVKGEAYDVTNSVSYNLGDDGTPYNRGRYQLFPPLPDGDASEPAFHVQYVGSERDTKFLLEVFTDDELLGLKAIPVSKGSSSSLMLHETSIAPANTAIFSEFLNAETVFVTPDTLRDAEEEKVDIASGEIVLLSDGRLARVEDAANGVVTILKVSVGSKKATVDLTDSVATYAMTSNDDQKDVKLFQKSVNGKSAPASPTAPSSPMPSSTNASPRRQRLM